MHKRVYRLERLDAIPKQGRRIRYTCLHVSKDNMAIGTTSGSVQFYQRSSLKFIRMISLVSMVAAEQDGVTLIRFWSASLYSKSRSRLGACCFDIFLPPCGWCAAKTIR